MRHYIKIDIMCNELNALHHSVGSNSLFIKIDVCNEWNVPHHKRGQKKKKIECATP